MSVSAMFGIGITTPATAVVPKYGRMSFGGGGGGGGAAVIECSSRPQKKSTAHHRKSRPKKTQPWDIRRKPAVYAPTPPLPPDWTPFSSSSAAEDAGNESQVSAAVAAS